MMARPVDFALPVVVDPRLRIAFWRREEMTLTVTIVSEEKAEEQVPTE
jgi:hypothetical protein